MFLYMETPTNHMHVTGVFLVDPATAPGGFSFAQAPGHHGVHLGEGEAAGRGRRVH